MASEVSGFFHDLIAICNAALGTAGARMHATTLRWDEHGNLLLPVPFCVDYGLSWTLRIYKNKGPRGARPTQEKDLNEHNPVQSTGVSLANNRPGASSVRLTTYVAAINSNDTDTLMADLTDDIVYQAPNEPEIVGKEAVRKWVDDYFVAYRTQWEKTSIGFSVIGDWAFERYSYRSKDVDKKTAWSQPIRERASTFIGVVMTESGELPWTDGALTFQFRNRTLRRLRGLLFAANSAMADDHLVPKAGFEQHSQADV